MIRIALFVLGFLSVFSNSCAFEGAATLADPESFAPVSSRSLVETKEHLAPGLKDWRITATNRGGTVSCRGEAQLPNGDEMTFIYDPEGQYGGGAWYFAVVHRKFSLPEGTQIPGFLNLDGRVQEWGQILAVGDWTGGERTASYVRAEFKKLDALIPALKNATTLLIRGKGVDQLEIPLPPLTRIIEALEKCYAEATGPQKESFWKDAPTSCQ
jgi:hypothetical protein